jgi:uroporphyrinogen decarboxylase
MDMRERVYRAIKFEQPDRVPLEVHYDIKTVEKYRDDLIKLLKKHPNHFLTVGYTPPKGFNGPHPLDLREGVDEWGVAWTTDVNQGIRVIRHPLETWDKLDTYAFPDMEAEGRFDQAEALIKSNKENRFVVGYVWFTLFERLWFLRGFKNCILDIMREDQRIYKLADMLVDFNIKATKKTLELGVDAIFFSDDYGHQRGLIFPLKIWINFFLPRWKKMFSIVHKYGAINMLHSCGNVEPLIPYLIDAGLDVLNPVQPQAMNIEALGEKYRGKICFFGGVDVQGTLPRGSKRDVENEVKHLIWTLGDENGGYIGGTSHTILCDTPLENIKAMYKAFEKWGSFIRLRRVK